MTNEELFYVRVRFKIKITKLYKLLIKIDIESNGL
jgi:hypothetical protein